MIDFKQHSFDYGSISGYTSNYWVVPIRLLRSKCQERIKVSENGRAIITPCREHRVGAPVYKYWKSFEGDLAKVATQRGQDK